MATEIETRLTRRRELFVDALVGEARGNRTKAAVLAGYGPKHARKYGSYLTTLPAVQAAIDARLEGRALRDSEIIDRLCEQACGPTPDMCDPETGKPDLKRIFDSGRLHMLAEVIPTRNGPSIKFPSSQGALKLLAQIRGMLKDRVEHSFDPDTLRLYSIEQLRQMQKGLDPGPPALANGQPVLPGPVIDVTPEPEPNGTGHLD